MMLNRKIVFGLCALAFFHRHTYGIEESNVESETVIFNGDVLIDIPEHLSGMNKIDFFVQHYMDILIESVHNEVDEKKREQQHKILVSFKQVIDSITDTTTLDTLEHILNSTQLLYKKMTAEYGNTTLQEDCIRLLLIKTAPLMVNALQKNISASLDRGQSHLDYWVAQKHHPISYFFHKSPIKWFYEEKQQVEINRHLSHLRATQDHHFALFGALHRHAKSFGANPYAQIVDEWLDNIVHMVALFRQKECKKNSTIVEQFRSSAHFLAQCPHGWGVGDAPDHHLKRHWMIYTATACAAVASASTWYLQPSWLIDGMQKGNTFIHKFPSLWNEGDIRTKKALGDLWNEFSTIQKNGQYLIKTLSFKPSTQQDFVEKIGAYNFAGVWAFVEVATKILADSGLVSPTKGMSLNPADWLWGGGGLGGLSGPVASFLKAFEPFAKQCGIKAGLYSLAGLGLVGGAGISTWLVYKLLKQKPHDFGPLCTTLLDIDRILNLYDRSDRHVIATDISDADWGKLLYSLEKIKREVHYIKEPERWEFEHDIQQLSLSSTLDVRQKRELLKIMYKQYQFLFSDKMKII